VKESKAGSSSFPLKPYEIALEVLCVVLLAAQLLVIVLNYPTLPDRLPSHFDFAGKPDRWGDKSRLWTYPIISFVAYTAMTTGTITQSFVQFKIANFAKEGTEHAYRMKRLLLILLKVSSCCIPFIMAIGVMSGRYLNVLFLFPFSWLPLLALFLKEQHFSDRKASG
jgi:uncharacterized membrane protein